MSRFFSGLGPYVHWKYKHLYEVYIAWSLTKCFVFLFAKSGILILSPIMLDTKQGSGMLSYSLVWFSLILSSTVAGVFSPSLMSCKTKF